MMCLPKSASTRLLPERKPSPTPTSRSKDPTPHAMPNMVRNERNLCAHRLRKICPKISVTLRIQEPRKYPCESAWSLALMNKDGETYALITEEIRPFPSV